MRSLVYRGEEKNYGKLLLLYVLFSSSWAYDSKTEIRNDRALTFTWT